MENLNITEERWAELGFGGFAPAVSMDCGKHSDPGLVAIQQWDASAKTWSLVSDFIEPDRDVVDALILEDSEAYAAENNITPRDCN